MGNNLQDPSWLPGSVDQAPRPTRWTFTAEYKARVVAEFEAAPHGETSAVLPREGPFHSHLWEWAAIRVAGMVAALDTARAAHSNASPDDPDHSRSPT